MVGYRNDIENVWGILDQQSEDIRRLMDELEDVHEELVCDDKLEPVCSTSLVLAEMKERYDA